jgi:cobalt/nickel transport protein
MSPRIPSPSRSFVLTVLSASFVIAIALSPFASSDPDGLDRVAQDHKFEHRASETTIAKQLPFYQWFDEYALRGVPDAIATPMAGLLGTAITFGLAWGVGKLTTRRSRSSER